MKLKPDAVLADFLQEVARCEGEVYFETTEGDILNLKSQLSKYIFLAAAASQKETFLPVGRITWDLKADHKLLQAFLTEE